jgi:hypothetical protein
MSKQVKLKFKKSLKKAEFVHADLEYHEELISDAKREFFAKVEEIFNKLSPEDKKKINDVKKKKMAEQSKREAIERSEEEEDEEIGGLPDNEDMLSTDGSDEEEDEETGATRVKSSDLRKLFHEIADICHPDKTEARGLAEHEIRKLEKVFKEAQSAYKGGNWYLLYIIALDLGIEVEDPTGDHIEWIEEDIQYTLEKISQIGTLVVWVWYNGDVIIRLMAMQNYFQQSFGFDLRV